MLNQCSCTVHPVILQQTAYCLFKVVLDKILPIFLFFEKLKHGLYIVSSKTKSKLNQKQRNHAMFVISLSKTLIFLEHRNDGIRWFNCSQFKWHGV